MKKFVLVMLTACSVFVSSAQRDTNEYVTTGSMVPMFEAYTGNGTPITPEVFKGKYALVVFFATWCPHCQHELPELQEVYKKYGNRDDFQLLLINRGEPRDTVAAFFRRNGYTMPFYLDPSGQALTKFARGGIPRSYLIDKNGKVVGKATGFGIESDGISNVKKLIRLENYLK